MGYKERVIYILKIIVLISIIVWLLYSDRERYVEEYNAKIEALEQKVDSLHSINDELTFKIDTLNGQILSLDKEIYLTILPFPHPWLLNIFLLKISYLLELKLNPRLF